MNIRVRFRPVQFLAAFSVCCVAHAYTPGGAFTVPAGGTVTVTDTDIADFNSLASVTFADAAGVLVFNTATPPTVQISGNGTIRKTSSAVWALGTNLSSFTGVWDFAGGLSSIDVQYALGHVDASSNVYVRSGATLRLNNSAFLFKSRYLHLAGDGYQNNGAFQVAKSSSTGNYMLHGIVLDADAKISFTNSAYLFLSYGTTNTGKLIDLLGRRLTVSCDGQTGGNVFYLLPGTIAGPGQIVVTNTVNTGVGTLAPRGVKMLDPSVEIVMCRNTRILVYNHSPTNYFAKLTVEGDNCSIYHEHQYKDTACGADGSHDLWAGEVNLKNETSQLIVGMKKRDDDTADMGYTLGILGPVTGPGSLEFATPSYSYNIGRYHLTCPTNSYTGETVFDGSHGATLVLTGSNNIPVYAKARSTTPLTLVVSGEEHGWDGSSIARFAESFTYTGNDPTRRVVVDASALPGKSVTFGGLADELSADVVSGIVGAPGTELTFRSPLGRPLQPQAVSNTVTLTGTETMYVTNVPAFSGRSCGGDIVIGGAKDLRFAATYPFYVSAAHGASRVVITNSAVCRELNTANLVGFDTEAISIGYRENANEYPGDVLVGKGAVVTGRVQIAGGECRRGRVTQTGGEVAILSCFNDSSSGNCASIGYGSGANGYYDLVDGKLTYLGEISIGGYGTLGTGVIRQRGGSFSVLRHPNTTGTGATEAWSVFGFSAGTRAHYMTTGGKAYFSGTVLTDRGANSRGIITIGGTAEVVCDTSLMYGYAAGTRSILNLNDGGTLTFAGFYSRYNVREYVGTGTTMGWLPHFVVNANGGRLRVGGAGGANSYTILGGPAITNVDVTAKPPHDRIALYAKGLIIDVTNKWQQACGLITPATGKGIASIPWTRHEKMLVSPWVEIEGDGIGASAIVDVDPETGDAIGVIITSPGCDYTWAKATIFDRYGGATKTNHYVTVDCTLADNDGSGGLTVEGVNGSGTLVLAETNTYRGATVLAGGTLQLGIDKALPVDSMVVLAGGKLDMNGKTLADGSSLPKRWGVDVDRVRASGTVTNNWDLNFPAGATFTVLNADELTETDLEAATLLYVNGTVSGAPEVQGVDNPRWKAAWSGNRLTLRYLRGMIFSFR